jgi:SAM-dependent methyltransferase
MKKYFIDRLGLHIDSFTANRYRLVKRYLIRGKIKSLNIGTGGGVETIRLLLRDNSVTTIEIDKNVSATTRQRIVRNGFAEQHTERIGHLLDIDIKEKFFEIMMCEVLEHIKDDEKTIQKLSELLEKDGRLILSTPTALYGQLSGDSVSVHEDKNNPDFHVRVGYQGLELDRLLYKNDLLTIKRVYNGFILTQFYHQLERKCRNITLLKPIYLILSLLGRFIVPVLELYRVRPSDQITIAVRL